MKKVNIESSQVIFNDFFKIVETYLSYERFDKRMSPVVRRLNFERGDSVAAIVFNVTSQKVLLVNQFKYPTLEKQPGWIDEVVAGTLEAGESSEVAIRREIREEIGYEVNQLIYISTFYVSPGGSSERIVLYYAEVDDTGRIADGGGSEDEGEDIKTAEFSLSEIFDSVSSGRIADAKTIIAIMWLKDRCERKEV
jgi:nudix-type nucleoside diphosphatase (YffH/AdpP family)